MIPEGVVEVRCRGAVTVIVGDQGNANENVYDVAIFNFRDCHVSNSMEKLTA